MTATDMGKVSDGYHTFNELYEHRNLLFLNLAASNPEIAFKTRLDDKKEKYGGWFILGINTEYGQITYHLPEKYWEEARVKEMEYNYDYDGHTAYDVCHRLLFFVRDQV